MRCFPRGKYTSMTLSDMCCGTPTKIPKRARGSSFLRVAPRVPPADVPVWYSTCTDTMCPNGSAGPIDGLVPKKSSCGVTCLKLRRPMRLQSHVACKYAYPQNDFGRPESYSIARTISMIVRPLRSAMPFWCGLRGALHVGSGRPSLRAAAVNDPLINSPSPWNLGSLPLCKCGVLRQNRMYAARVSPSSVWLRMR